MPQSIVAYRVNKVAVLLKFSTIWRRWVGAVCVYVWNKKLIK